MTALFEVDALAKSFGGLKVTQDVSLALSPGDRVALIGPNGAGKTTFVNLVTGAIKPDGGRVTLAGEDVTRLGVTDRVRRGLVRSFQISRLFRDMSVEDNVLVALLQRTGQAGIIHANAHQVPGLREAARGLLHGLHLEDLSSRIVREIAYGQQRLIEIAIAMALKPKVLLLDEPAAGVPQAESPLILKALEALPADIAILMIEHDMDLVFRFAKRVVVLAAGAIIFEGTPAEAGTDPRVREAYLGNYAGQAAGGANGGDHGRGVA